MLQRGVVSHASAANQQLRAQAAELERQFDVYKLRLAEKRRDAAAAAAAAAAALVVVDHHPPNIGVEDGSGGRGAEKEDDEVGRGRRYEAYVRRRDEKLRQGWLARMERKEAEVKALWARLDQPRRPPHSADLTAPAAREVKPRNTDKPISPARPRCTPSPAMKLPRLKSTTTPSSSPAAAAASPRLSSSRRVAPHPEPQPPATPRKENRMSPPSTTTTPRQQLKTLSRTRSSFVKDGKEERGGSRGSSYAVAGRESPRPPRVQPPRASYDGGRKQAAAPEPLRLRRSRASSPLVAPRQEQVDFFARLQENNARNKDAEKAKNTGADGNGGNDEMAKPDDTPPGDAAAITGDSDTEPSYVYVKKDGEAKGFCADLGETFEDTMASSSPSSSEAETDKTVKEESPAINGGGEAGSSSRGESSSESLYSNVQSSFSHGSELAADSPLRALSTEQLLEADAAMLRKKRHDEEDDEAEQSIVILPTTGKSGGVPVVAGTQSPMVDAVAGGIKRFLTFGKKNAPAPAPAVVIVERAPPPAGDDDIVNQGWDSADSIKPEICCSYAVSDDDLDKSYVISPHGAVRSLQSFPPSSPTRPELKETTTPPPAARSPKVHRSFFSFSTFKNRGN